MKEVQDLIVRLTADRLGEERARELARILSEGGWTHDYPITFEEAKSLGLPVKDKVPPEVYQLMELYPQASVNRPGVEYTPYPVIPQPRASDNR